jgi:hypothetical protein
MGVYRESFYEKRHPKGILYLPFIKNEVGRGICGGKLLFTAIPLLGI